MDGVMSWRDAVTCYISEVSVWWKDVRAGGASLGDFLLLLTDKANVTKAAPHFNIQTFSKHL